jgi:circadian clock protein KaiC
MVDSFRTVVRKAHGESELQLQAFVQDLALHLASWQATTFLLGEYDEGDMRGNPAFTVCDGLFWLYQVVERNAVVRKLQIVKLRGQSSVPGMHTFRITEAGLETFSRTLGLAGKKEKPRSKRRLSIGIAELDTMMGGGILEGDSVLVSGASGTGKSLLTSQFVAEGIRQGEPAVVAVFEERPRGYVERAENFDLDLETAQKAGKLNILYPRPLDLSVDETLQEILKAVEKIDAKRLVIDSLAGFEMALAPGFRADFRESLYRMIGALAGIGVTVLSTVEIEESFTDFRFSNFSVSFLADDIIRLSYVEIDGQLRKILMIVKMRGSGYSNDIREYHITPNGFIIGPRMKGYRGLITRVPQLLDCSARKEELPDKPKGRE